ncbi:DUF488 domain-containing protein [Yeosuana sp.]|uniref:DUF488 domain-containing protein n=1 Tax=Yeosuana sp. TaxID=2529388 RepID=UPI00405507BE|tara:strand:- start:11056 stop:11409 length:354 start_codon:yes stop_codon:yes gene_type:complete
MYTIGIKRIYDEPSDKDGYRVLVDRLWPRGISKKDANLDEWNKEIAPSTELRKWFDHKAERFDEFTRLYREELMAKEEELNRLRTIAKKNDITLLYGAKNPKINHAVVLRDLLVNRL